HGRLKPVQETVLDIRTEDEENRRTGVTHDVLEFTLGVFRIESLPDCADRRGGKIADEELRARSTHGRDAVTGGYTAGQKCTGERIDLSSQFRVCPGPGLEDHCSVVRNRRSPFRNVSE